MSNTLESLVKELELLRSDAGMANTFRKGWARSQDANEALRAEITRLSAQCQRLIEMRIDSSLYTPMILTRKLLGVTLNWADGTNETIKVKP